MSVEGCLFGVLVDEFRLNRIGEELNITQRELDSMSGFEKAELNS
jgi:hypothetical protein